MDSMDSITKTCLGLAGVAGCAYLLSQAKTEGFGMLPNMSIKRMTEYQDQKGQFYTIPGNFQSRLAQRFDGTNNGYGAFIRTSKPASQYTATSNLTAQPKCTNCNVRQYPKESYCGANGGTNGAAGPMPGAVIPEHFCSGCTGGEGNSYKRAGNLCNASAGQKTEGFCGCEGFANGGTQITDQLPISSMSQDLVLNNLGAADIQPIIYDRFIYANQKSRLYGLADPVRGDLAIAPIRDQWFRPPVNPVTDLRAGALNVLGGNDNSTTSDLLNLQQAYSGGLLGTGSGVALLNQASSFLSSGSSDVTISAFP